MLKKLFLYYKNWFHKNNTDYSITISLKPDYDIDVNMSCPNLENYNDHTIVDLAEKYAKLLLYMNSSVLKLKLRNFLNDSSKSENIKTKLFFDNIISFHDIMLQEIRTIKKQDYPLIRPTSVFNNR